MDSTSVSLLERLRQPGQPEAWARLVELYTPLLLYWFRQRGLQPHDAADLVQEVFATLVRKLPGFSYDREKTFRGWLRTVALNKWRDWLKGKNRLPPAPGRPDRSELAGPDDALAFQEGEHRQYLVRRALQIMRTDFGPTTWKACWETVVCGRPASEVARELGLTENAVYMARCKVLQRLRRELDGLLD
jgi:RNA polymerase sigma-70 factor (ECF subfamily)